MLHDLCNWVDDVGFMFSPGHDANSEKEWNPLYRITGRPEAAPSVLNASMLPRRERYPLAVAASPRLGATQGRPLKGIHAHRLLYTSHSSDAATRPKPSCQTKAQRRLRPEQGVVSVRRACARRHLGNEGGRTASSAENLARSAELHQCVRRGLRGMCPKTPRADAAPPFRATSCCNL